MLPGTQNTHTEIESALQLAADVVARYRMAALCGPLAAARAAAREDEIVVAVLGRFKAGKSSFLNQLAGRGVLPTGVVPVTAVVTELRCGPRVKATVHYRDGRAVEIPLEQAGGYIAEKENPENIKNAGRIAIELPELRRLRGLKLVDTPGLESALAHNTRTSLEWLPNAGLALVAISVDQPLSERDLDLLKRLYRHTPKIGILLTKADLLSERELAEVMEFVRSQIAKHLAESPRIFPYSTKAGYERLRGELESALLDETLRGFEQARAAIAARKADTLLREASDYLALALKSAELVESEREALQHAAVGGTEAIEQVRITIHLAVQNAAAQARAQVSEILEKHQNEIERVLLKALVIEFPRWTRSLAGMLAGFEDWLGTALRDLLADVSAGERRRLLASLDGVRRQAFGTLQQFRDRLSERTLRAFGVPLRTTESEIVVAEPRVPDIRVGRVFDRNWELLSPIIPVWTIRRLVHRHFERTVPRAVYANISRLSAQWEESIRAALGSVEREARRRLDELTGTVAGMIAGGGRGRVTEMHADLEEIERARQSLRGLP